MCALKSLLLGNAQIRREMGQPARGSGRRHKAWGGASAEPQDRQHQNRAEPAKRPIAVRLHNVNRDDSTVGRSAGFGYFSKSILGFRWRSIPGFMLSTATAGLGTKDRFGRSKALINPRLHDTA